MLKAAQIATINSSNKHHEKVIGYSLAMFEHAYSHKPLYQSLSGEPGWMIVQQQISTRLSNTMQSRAEELRVM